MASNGTESGHGALPLSARRTARPQKKLPRFTARRARAPESAERPEQARKQPTARQRETRNERNSSTQAQAARLSHPRPTPARRHGAQRPLHPPRHCRHSRNRFGFNSLARFSPQSVSTRHAEIPRPAAPASRSRPFARPRPRRQPEFFHLCRTLHAPERQNFTRSSARLSSALGIFSFPAMSHTAAPHKNGRARITKPPPFRPRRALPLSALSPQSLPTKTSLFPPRCAIISLAL